MKPSYPPSLIVRLAFASTAAVLAVIATVDPDWLEDLINIHTTRGDAGGVEWLIIFFFAALAATWGSAAAADWWRRQRREEVMNKPQLADSRTRRVRRVPRRGTLQADSEGGESRDVVTETGTRLARNIRLAREHAQLSQRQLADRVGVSRTRIADWEAGRHSPNHEHLEAIADATGKTVAWLFDEHPELAG